MTLTLHKEVGRDGFGIPLPEMTSDLTPSYHATKAAEQADSDTCGLSRIELPDVVRLTDGRALVGWDGATTVAPERAIKHTNGNAVMCGEIFEIDVTADGDVTKVVARVPYTANYDVSLVIDPTDGTLITLWANHTTDTHTTLNTEKYDTPADLAV
jgi:hypothetical protein